MTLRPRVRSLLGTFGLEAIDFVVDILLLQGEFRTVVDHRSVPLLRLGGIWLRAQIPASLSAAVLLTDVGEMLLRERHGFLDARGMKNPVLRDRGVF